MEAIEMIKERRSVRKYKNERVSRETMEQIVDAARWSPSWANFQIARYTVVDNPELIKQIADKGVLGFAYNIGTLNNAPGVMVLSYVKGKSGTLSAAKSGKVDDADYATSKANEWEMFDAGIACQTFCLAAHNYGVGSCIFGVIDDKAIAQILNIPEEETVAAIVTFGYPDEQPKPTPRKTVDDITRYF